MLELLLSLVTGSNGLIAGLVAILGVVTAAYFKGRSAANQNNQAKEATENVRQLEEIDAAAKARNSVQSSDGVRDDKYRRD